MPIWGIADIHASRTDPRTGLPTKPMHVFVEEWQDHVERLERAWNACVAEDDTVVVAGDIDWSLHLHDAMETLMRMDSWKGQKILLRGNHDYWWSSKVTNKVRKQLPPSLRVLHNDAVQVEGINICGTKGSPVPGAIDWTEENAKLLNREIHRLGLSLSLRDVRLPTLVAMHYPPFFPPGPRTEYQEMLERHGVHTCVYGHLHGRAGRSGPRGRHASVAYCLVAADATGFRPVLLGGEGVLLDTPELCEARERGEQVEDRSEDQNASARQTGSR